MATVPVPPPPLLASHAAIRAAASLVSHSRRVRLAGDHPPQVAALRRDDWVKLICGASFERWSSLLKEDDKTRFAQMKEDILGCLRGFKASTMTSSDIVEL